MRGIEQHICNCPPGIKLIAASTAYFITNILLTAVVHYRIVYDADIKCIRNFFAKNQKLFAEKQDGRNKQYSLLDQPEKAVALRTVPVTQCRQTLCLVHSEVRIAARHAANMSSSLMQDASW